jgi:glucose dehydrogenase
MKGGAPTWLTGAYDPDLDLVYWGTGNGGPWNAEARKGDNLYVDSVLAFRPKTGQLVWHYQFSPNDPFDYDSTEVGMLVDLRIDGRTRKVLAQANRNGFFYVLDRADGKLLAANPYVKVNWADRIDMATGRPVESAKFKSVRAGGDRRQRGTRLGDRALALLALPHPVRLSRPADGASRSSRAGPLCQRGARGSAVAYGTRCAEHRRAGRSSGPPHPARRRRR